MTKDCRIFVCTRGKKCPKRGSEEVAAALFRAAQAAGAGNALTIKECKCLDLCKKGPAVVVMPDKIRYGRVTPADAVEIISTHLAKKGSVQRLLTKKKE